MVKIFLAMFLMICSCVLPSVNVQAAPYQPLNPAIFEWVQSTPRAGYFFNKAVMAYEVTPDGYIDTNVLIVPTVKIFDTMAIQDITMKRQWKDLSTHNFDQLAAAAEYLRIDLAKQRVEFTSNEYLDRGYNPLHVSYTKNPQDLTTMGAKEVDYKLYMSIIDYAKEHQQEIIKRMLSEGAKLQPEQLAALGLDANGDKLPANAKKKVAKQHHTKQVATVVVKNTKMQDWVKKLSVQSK